MSCSGCNLNKPIQNKKYNLCSDCVFRKNHKGQSQQEVYAARSADKPKKIYQFKPQSKPIKQQTSKEANIKSKLVTLKQSIRIEAIQSDMYYCWGTGDTGDLDCSHILSVGQFKHLELDKDNINLFSRKAHEDWESWNIERMGRLLTFEKDIDYVKQHSSEYYSKIMHLMQNYLQTNPQGDLSSKFNRIILAGAI